MINSFLLFLNIGTSEMILIVVVILILFGGKKLPELARGLGRGIREFKDASDSIKRDISDQINNFEEEINTVTSDVKSLAEPSVEEKPTEEKPAETQTEVKSPTAHQDDISHSDQYYRNYNYDYPEEETTTTSSTEKDNATGSISSESKP